MPWKLISNRLNVEGIESTYECAIVLALHEDLWDNVVSTRINVLGNELSLEQLDPHITVLYGGFHSPRDLEKLDRLSRKISSREFDFEIENIGFFYEVGGKISNVHYKINSQEICDLHAELLIDYAELGFRIQTEYHSKRYLPHISIVDKVKLTEHPTINIDPGMRFRKHNAGSCQLIGRPGV